MAISPVVTLGFGSFGSPALVATMGFENLTIVSVSGIEVECRQTRIVIASGLTRLAGPVQQTRVISQARRED